MITSRYQSTVRITRGGTTYLGPRISKQLLPARDDRFYDVQAHDTLQGISARFFGSAELWWVVADFNDIVDPFIELEAGQTLRIPSESRLWMEVLA